MSTRKTLTHSGLRKLENVGNQWRSQPEMLGRAKDFDFKRATVFGLGHRFSQHKMAKIR